MHALPGGHQHAPVQALHHHQFGVRWVVTLQTIEQKIRVHGCHQQECFLAMADAHHHWKKIRLFQRQAFTVSNRPTL